MKYLIESKSFTKSKTYIKKFEQIKYEELIDAINSNDIVLVRSLIRSGADVNVKDPNVHDRGNTALMCAIKIKNINIVKLLMDAGADVNMVNDNKDSPLIEASYMDNELTYRDVNKLPYRDEVIKMLINAGADVNFQNDFGGTALNYILNKPNALKMFKFFINSGADIYLKDDLNFTTLMYAVASNNIGVVKELIRSGIDINAQNNYGGTALMFAARKISIAKILIDAGADLNIRNDIGEDFIDSLTDRNRNIILKAYPEKYKEYLEKKDAEKYNL